SNRTNPLPIGIVDPGGVIDKIGLSPERLESWKAGYSEPVEIVLLPNEEEARMSLESNSIQTYYVLAADYSTSRKVDQYYFENPGRIAERQFFDYLQLNLAIKEYPQNANRAALGTEVIVRSVDGKRQVLDSGPTFGLLMPLFISLAFLAMMLMSSGYMMSAVAEEKENRTMEILVTSISPFELISGKVLGIVGISMTLMATWTIFVVSGILIAANMGVGFFSNLTMDWRTIIAIAAISIPAYVLATALMTAIGSMVSTEQEGQSVSVIFVILHMLPLYLGLILFNNPFSPIIVVLSMTPFTAMMMIGFRNLFTIVPSWQVIVSFFVQILCALGGLWLASQALRIGMLRVGKKPNWSKLFNTGNRDLGGN
ncbi:ABC transporter permease, partial [Chloroflexota bacterium]